MHLVMSFTINTPRLTMKLELKSQKSIKGNIQEGGLMIVVLTEQFKMTGA